MNTAIPVVHPIAELVVFHLGCGQVDPFQFSRLDVHIPHACTVGDEVLLQRFDKGAVDPFWQGGDPLVAAIEAVFGHGRREVQAVEAGSIHLLLGFTLEIEGAIDVGPPLADVVQRHFSFVRDDLGLVGHIVVVALVSSLTMGRLQVFGVCSLEQFAGDEKDMAIVAGKRVVKQGEGGGIHRHLDLLAIGIGLLPAQQETAKRLGAVDIKAVGQRLGITEIAPLREGQGEIIVAVYDVKVRRHSSGQRSSRLIAIGFEDDLAGIELIGGSNLCMACQRQTARQQGAVANIHKGSLFIEKVGDDAKWQPGS